MHGGKAPQVQQSARERLAALVDPAITTMGVLVRQRKQTGVAFRAARDILDRGGLKAPEKVDVTVERVPDEQLDARLAELEIEVYGASRDPGK